MVPPTDRVVRKVGEHAWRPEPKHEFMRPRDSTLPRASAAGIVNKMAFDMDQDGKLDEAELFQETRAGRAAAAAEVEKATEEVVVAQGRSKDGKDGKVKGAGFDEEVQRRAAERALVGEILHRNHLHVDLISTNPGGRDATKDHASAMLWKKVGDGPNGLAHFDSKATIAANVDSAMAMVADPSTYNVRPLSPCGVYKSFLALDPLVR